LHCAINISFSYLRSGSRTLALTRDYCPGTAESGTRTYLIVFRCQV